MHFLSIACSLLLITMCVIMQPQSVAAKPFIFKFFVPQGPARTDSSAAAASSSSSSSSSSISTGIDFTSILTTKLNLLTSLLRTGLSSGVSAGFNFGFNKLFPNTQRTTTRRPYTSTTATTPDAEFEPESSTKADITTTTLRTTTTKTTTKAVESSSTENDKSIEDERPTGIDARVTTTKSDNASTTARTATERSKNNGYDYTTPKASTAGDINSSVGTGLEYTTARTTAGTPQVYDDSPFKSGGYDYHPSNQGMSENEISNDIMAISHQYLPPF